MRLYTCPVCDRTIYFENLRCQCNVEIAYDPVADQMRTEFQACANRASIDCNWQAAEDGGLCRSCALTETHPDLSVPENTARWAKSEAAKRWVLVNLMSLGWFDASDQGLSPTFDFLAEKTGAGKAAPVMGHADGHITINVAEADPAEIVVRRLRMGEPYRTMIGHFRHELAHFLFYRLSDQPEFLSEFRQLFGDETADYGAALDRYYADGPAADWQTGHISAYASSHPHEDWAETAAHVLHLVDMVDTARAVDLVRAPEVTDQRAEEVISAAVDLGLAVNQINRAMGLGDIYPFVITQQVLDKMIFAYRFVTRTR